MKSKTYYFRIAFVPIGLGLFSGLLVYGLLMSTDEERFSFGLLLNRALIVSFGTAMVLGLLNIFIRIDPRRNPMQKK